LTFFQSFPPLTKWLCGHQAYEKLTVKTSIVRLHDKKILSPVR
jgi:hypothetical protein